MINYIVVVRGEGAVVDKRRIARIVGLILVSGLVGYLIGPPLAHAAANLVVVKDSKTKAKARVTQGNLWVDASGSFVHPYPFFVLGSNTGNATVTSSNSFVSGIAADGALTLTADTDCDGTGGDTLWVAGNETSYTFEFSVFVCGPIAVTNAVGVTWTVYGDPPAAIPSRTRLQQAAARQGAAR